MEDPGRYPIWALLRQARREAELSQRALAERAGTSQAAVARYERGRVLPDIPTVFRLLRACGFDLRLDIQPHDDHDERLVTANLRRTPRQRVDANRNAVSALVHASGHRAAHA